MKRLTLGLLLAFSPAAATPAVAGLFHVGGVANCEGCHTIHNSNDGLPVTASPGGWLLKKSDPGSICLNCHAGPGSAVMAKVVSNDGSALTPGGDFYWLTKSFTWATGSSAGASHGHNIVAADYGFFADGSTSQAPGGTYPSADLTCTSCHDPHGRTRGAGSGAGLAISESGSYGAAPTASTSPGSYRMLGGAGYNGGGHVTGFSFINPAPVARQNNSLPYAETASSHVDYGSGMSEWCVNCHSSYQTGNHSAGFTHPSGNETKFSPPEVANYNAYVRTGDLSGNFTSAYLQFAPFERGVTDPTQLDPTSAKGPDANSNVMCLSCHRAHASAFRAAGRWDFGATLLANSHPGFGDGGVGGSDVLNSYYGRNIVSEFGAGQGKFCEKCHP